MLGDLDATARAAHGAEAAAALFDLHPNARLLVRTSQALVATLLLIIALLLVASSFAHETGFQRRFCKIALVIHGLMAFYRFQYQSQLPMLKNDIPGQLVGDAIFAATWIACLMTNPLQK